MLEQARTLLACVTDEQYVATVPAAFNASIGVHLRHCLDHFTSFLAGTAESRINYDHRERNTTLERNREAALCRVQEIQVSIDLLNPASLAKPVNITSKVLTNGEFAQEAASSFARELMYVVAHTLHHFALIHVMCNLLKADLPPNFGIAPSTIEHLEAVLQQPTGSVEA